MRYRFVCLVSTLLLASYFSVAGVAPLVITTTSSSEYQKSPITSIYPAFVDGINYQSWTEKGHTDYFQLSASGGTLPYSWSLYSGSLPDGMTLNPKGQLSGTPAKEGTFNFTVKVTDSNGGNALKKLDFTAEPYRSKWMADAKFGIMVQWGPQSHPVLYTKDDIKTFESRIKNFNADEWADAVHTLGGKVLNFTVKSGLGIRLWPSTTPSKFELKTERDIVSELIAACHKKDIKFVAYFAPDNTWNKKHNDVGSDGTWGTLNKGLIKELVSMGVDGFWIDVTSSPEVHKGSDPKWFPWKEILPMMRSINPRIVCANNPGTHYPGTVLRYPDTDVIIYEGNAAPGEHALRVAKPTTIQKKVAIEVDNMLDNTWGWRTDSTLRAPKSAEMIINNIEQNWAVGATVMLNYPVQTDGTIIPQVYKATLEKIGKFVRNNQGWAEMPQASLDDSKIYTNPQKLIFELKPSMKVYYTMDGSEPNMDSKQYSEPIELSRSTRIRAISVQNGKTSKKFDTIYNFSLTTTKSAKLSASSLPVAKVTPATNSKILKKEPNNYFRGMKITIGRKALVLNRIGRRFVEGNTNNHAILIKRYADDSPILSTQIDSRLSLLEPDGYQYITIPDTKLEAGKSYIIASQEGPEDLFVFHDFKSIEKNADFRTVGHFILSPVGDRQPIKDDQLGAVLKLDYKTTSPENKNLALGSHATLSDNGGYSIATARNVLYAENGVDGDMSTIAQAGGRYAWTFNVDLTERISNIKKVSVHFGENAYSTHFLIRHSIDGKRWTELVQVKNNSASYFEKEVISLEARYFKITSLKPDAKGQEGNQMGIIEFEVFN